MGCERGQRDRSDLLLGESPVVVVGFVGDTGRQTRRCGVRRDGEVERDDRQRVVELRIPGCGGAGEDGLVRAAELLQHPDRGGAETAVAQQLCDSVGGVVLADQHEDPASGMEVTGHRGEWSADRAGDVDRGHVPAEAGTGERDRGRMRDDADPVGTVGEHERGTDAVEHRVATREHRDALAGEPFEQRSDRLGHRRRPRFGPADLVGDQRQLAGAAHHHVRVAQDLRPPRVTGPPTRRRRCRRP